MNHRTKEEIDAILAELWPGAETRTVDLVTDDKVLFTLASMYEPPGVKYTQLMALADFFGTKRIDTESSFSNGGCETCDYGSSYGFTMMVVPDTAAA